MHNQISKATSFQQKSQCSSKILDDLDLDLERNKRASEKKLKHCIVKVSCIDQSSRLVTKNSDADFQIFHFVEEEEKLKLKIENLQDL